MTTRWTEWQEAAVGRPPYVAWWADCAPPEFRDARGNDRGRATGFSFFTLPGKPPAAFEAAAAALWMGPAADKTQFERLSAAYGNFKIGQGPLPGPAHNDDFNDYNKANGWLPAIDTLPAIDPASVIIGVIDSGIPLAAPRLRNAKETRFLAAWQQDAAHVAAGKHAQPYLPFGRELLASEIDTLIWNFTVAGPEGPVFLEHDFNVAAGLINMHDGLRSRELAGRASHGAFVADLAAGAEPAEADDLIRLIGVNLPNRASIGNSGVFLDYFATYALFRIVDIADAVWFRSVGSAAAGEGPKGFPIVVNLSFGQNAGGKDGHDQFGVELELLNARRRELGFRPVHVVIPVGNHNLARGSACLRLEANGGAGEIGFIAMPGDQSSNYLEIWSDVIANPDGLGAAKVPIPLEVAATPPRSAPETASAGLDRNVRSLRSSASPLDIARLHCDVRMRPDGHSYRVRYLLCAAPTLQPAGSAQETPAGRWSIVVRNTGPAPLRVFVHAQTDQSVRPQGRTGLQPRLDTADYDYFLPDGRPRDSYAHPHAAGAGDLETSKELMRHGSINATAMSRHVIAVTGHRRSDGRPADYAATGFRDSDPPVPDGPAHPAASFVTDDGPAHFGILAAGAAAGSLVAMRGTSFAAAQATRMIADLLRKNAAADPLDELRREAVAAEASPPQPRAGTTPPAPKVGAGRIASVRRRRIDRFG